MYLLFKKIFVGFDCWFGKHIKIFIAIGENVGQCPVDGVDVGGNGGREGSFTYDYISKYFTNILISTFHSGV